jgi:hypothetical protein
MKNDTDSAGHSPHSREPVAEHGASFKSAAKTRAKAAMTATMKRRALKPGKATPRREQDESSQG